MEHVISENDPDVEERSHIGEEDDGEEGNGHMNYDPPSPPSPIPMEDDGSSIESDVSLGSVVLGFTVSKPIGWLKRFTEELAKREGSGWGLEGLVEVFKWIQKEGWVPEKLNNNELNKPEV